MNANRAAAAVVAAVAAALFAGTFWFEQMPEGITRGFGAEVFPRLVLGTIIALAAMLAFIPPASGPLPRIPPMVWYSGGTLILFMAAVPVIGMMAAMLVYLIAVGLLWGERRRALLAVTSVLFIAAIWAVFVKGFGVVLPKGWFD